MCCGRSGQYADVATSCSCSCWLGKTADEGQSSMCLTNTVGCALVLLLAGPVVRHVQLPTCHLFVTLTSRDRRCSPACACLMVKVGCRGKTPPGKVCRAKHHVALTAAWPPGVNQRLWLCSGVHERLACSKQSCCSNMQD